MTIAAALQSLVNYPIPINTLEKICIDRGLVYTVDYTLAIGQSDSFRLSIADTYMWLYTSPDIKEQEISFTQAERDNFLFLANKIYSELEDPAFSGNSHGFIGENFNG